MLLWIVDFKLLEIGVAIEELLMIGDAVVLDPIVGANEAIGKPAHVSFPVADKEIEVVRSIARRRRCIAPSRRQQGQLQDSEQMNRAYFHKANVLIGEFRSFKDATNESDFRTVVLTL